MFALSPEPVPQPESTDRIVIKAISMDDDFKINEHPGNSIEIRIMNSYGHYSAIVSNTGKFWDKNSKYFQNNFNIFKKIVKYTLVEKSGDVSYSIIKEDMKEIVLKLEYYSLLSFNVQITLENEMNKILKLQNENKILKEKVRELEKEKVFTDKTKGWTRIRHSCTEGKYPISVKEFNEAKKICIEENYGGFVDSSKYNWYGIKTQANEKEGGPNYILNNLRKRDRQITEKPWGAEKDGRKEWDGDIILTPGAYFSLIKQKKDQGFEIVWDKKDSDYLEQLGISYMLS